MADHALNDHAPGDDFTTRVGEIVRAQGRVIDARFPTGQRPRVLNALTVTDDSAGPAITLEAIQHLDDDLVRCIALTSDAPSRSNPDCASPTPAVPSAYRSTTPPSAR